MCHISKVTTMKKSVLLVCIIAWISGIDARAQAKDYRSDGYHGNVMVTDYLGVFIGAETIHGVMAGRHNFIGAGAGFFLFPNSAHPTYLNVFADYHSYLKDKRSTPVLGIKAGVSHALNYYGNGGIQFRNGLLVEPSFSWSWGLKSGNGLSLGLGFVGIFPVGESRTSRTVLPLPKLSFGFEF